MKSKPIRIDLKRLNTVWGYAYTDERRIELDARMKPEKMLEIAIHEVAHVELPHLSEEAVSHLGKSVADVLLRLGYWREAREDE